MRFLYIALFLCFVSALAYAQDEAPWNNQYDDLDASTEIIAIVGEQISLTEMDRDDYCPKDYLCMDSRYNARYRVLETLSGNFPRDYVDFAVYDHYGKPRFSNFERVVLYLNPTQNGLVHRKYRFEPLFRLASGGYAFCGDPYVGYEEAIIAKNGRKDLKPFNFHPQIKLKLSDYLFDESEYHHLDQDDIREDFIDTMRRFAPPAFVIENNKAVCKMGMTPQDVVDIRFEYEFISEQEHEAKYRECWQAASLPDSGVTSLEKETSGFNACMNEGN